MKTALALAIILLTSPALADVVITLSDDEARVAMQLWEFGLKAAGDPAAKPYVVLTDKVRAAIAESQKPKDQPKKDAPDWHTPSMQNNGNGTTNLTPPGVTPQ